MLLFEGGPQGLSHELRVQVGTHRTNPPSWRNQ
jgi:hypothetical protein